MKALMLVGVVVLVLGIISFFVPFPHTEHQGGRLGDPEVGVTNGGGRSVPSFVSIILVVVGGGLMIAGRKG